MSEPLSVTPAHFINRELSLLEFHDRVLSQAENDQIPALERLRFLCISSTNLDEFFEIRVGGLKERFEAGSTLTGPEGLTPRQQLDDIAERAHHLVDRQYQILNQQLLPLLAEHHIRVIKREDWSDAQTAWLQQFFEHEVLPLLSPIGLDPAHPFPRILNKSLNFIVKLDGKDAFGRNSGQAIVQCPRALPDMIQLPADETGSGSQDFVFLSSIIHYFMDEIFFGMTVKGCYQFRVTRNSDLFVDEEESGDLRRAIEGELVYRQYGDEVRLEVAANCPDELLVFLFKQFEITETDLYRADGPVNLNRLASLIDLVARPELLYPPFDARVPRVLRRKANIFDAIKKSDILLHHPFDSFMPVVDFIRQAAKDPNVLTIKQTLYRTGANSIIVDELVAAAKAGKEVTVIIELLARFDEEANVVLAERLQEYGIHVVYGIVGYKTHAKMLMVARREGDKLRHYVHLGTGNYHPKTAQVYTDYGLLTCNKQIGDDVYRVFLQLTSLGKVSKLDTLFQSPFTLHKTMMRRIEREIENAQAGKAARIILKMNSLYEEQLARKLYEASQAGVQIDLIVRGVCQIRPGLPGVSDNIRVRSIVGRFLEHTRAYCFHNDGDPEVILASADWMSRNMFHRVEIGFPLLTKKLRDKVIKDLESYLADNSQAWELDSDGHYQLCRPGSDEPILAQQSLLDDAIQGAGSN
ncbi:RNA degradosome polyphosphate kinase [Saccharospirillum sp. MSK14-1]|uniref:polyphosphate kinase 1 n=1 Tax=Saccharospirillum sp. MSK14-1 TaxID=1897632 RepID=UPI000D33528D|nr:polyphosphate kinase 1 [Saccharospirillum sp. MSK14-1]PTY37488.1 RNA degradosome polyphosphate kinase [Saccharospirillum sp. MSK14-1]